VSGFENTVLREILDLTREEVTGGWRKLQREEFHDVCPSSDIIRAIKSKWTNKQEKNSCKI
jgi:hypothetical protein